MFGIIDKATGKVYAKSVKADLKFQRLLQKTEIAYPDREFAISEVNPQAKCVGDLPKQVIKSRS